MFQYPGGKSKEVKRILSIMPDHECYVEGFGGSGALLLNKPKSEINVYNDLDSELVNFFTVFREEPEKLIQLLEKIPYSFEYYEQAVDLFYDEGFDCEPLVGGEIFDNEVTDDHVNRAAIFFYLRYTQWGSKYHGRSGFGRSKQLNQAETFANATERLWEFVGFWDDVTIENVSYEKLIEYYDGENTVFYFDPPYMGTEGHYRESEFDHQKFCENVKEIEGYWITSYDDIPEPLKEYNYTQEKSTNFIDSGYKGEGKDTVESLIFNYDPDDVRKFTSVDQFGLKDMDHSSSESENNRYFS